MLLCSFFTSLLMVVRMTVRHRNSVAKRLKKLSAPANDEEIWEYTEACAAVEVEPADTLRKLARAFAHHVREHGYIVHPIRFAPPPASLKQKH